MKYQLEAHDPRRPRIREVEEFDATNDADATGRLVFDRAAKRTSSAG